MKGEVYKVYAGVIVVILAAGVMFNPLRAVAAPRRGTAINYHRPLTLDERVACRKAIEAVYHRRRIWPAANQRPKPPLSEVLHDAQIRAQVEDELRQGEALAEYWNRPITGKHLQAEMDRMTRSTRRPEMLKELFAALDNDPYLIAECLARPVLTRRLIRNWYGGDERFHGALKQRIARELEEVSATPPAARLRLLSGQYGEYELIRRADEAAGPGQGRGMNVEPVMDLSPTEWASLTGWLATYFHAPVRETEAELTDPRPRPARRNTTEFNRLPVNRISSLQEEDGRFFVGMILEKGPGRLRIATVEWRKKSFDAWWAEVQWTMPPEAEGHHDGYDYHLPAVSGVPCSNDTWTPHRS